MAKTLIFLGLAVVVVGLLLLVAPGIFSWFGRLPGDIRAGGERGRVFVPITSMLVVSVVLTIALNVLARWFR